MRGIPGPGKSRYAREQFGPATTILSAADFWSRETETHPFDPERIGEAHAWNFRRFLDLLAGEADGRRTPPLDTVVIDDTNIRMFELTPSLLAAAAYGVQAEIVPFWCAPAVAARRNVHGVPAATV